MRQVGKKPRCNPEVKLAEVPTVPDGMMGLRPRQQRKNYRKMNGEM
jgi:hypothetical protein